MKGVRSQPGHISRNHSHAVNEYIDQLEAEKKALIEALKASMQSQKMKHYHYSG